MSHTLTVRIDAVLAERLQAVAARTGQPVSTLVRSVVVGWLDENDAPRASTLLSRAGSVRGPGVPATNANVRARMQRAR